MHARHRWALAALLFAACSNDETPDDAAVSADSSATRDGSPSGRDGSAVDDAGRPLPLRCDGPTLENVSAPDHVVGDGSPESCTAEALQEAAAEGGVIVFDCGDAPITITVGSAITFTEESVVDGGGLVTLSGGGGSRIFYLDSGYDTPTPNLTVQRLSFRDGSAPAGGEDTAQGGGAIYRDGGSLTVLDCTFTDNHAPPEGQDVAGGAIYAFGGGYTVIARSTFTENGASNGGAVGSLNGDLSIYDSSFTGNAATGTDGNPGNGGCGGALYQDGRDEATTLCNVVIRGNTAGAIGGGVFRVSNDDSGSFTMDHSTVDANRVTPADSGNAGGLYLQGLRIAVTSSTISRNEAWFNGGAWLSEATVEMTNVTIAENTAIGSNGGGLWLAHEPTGTLRNCTIANNRSTGDSTVAGAIFGAGLTLVNTLIANNTSMYRPSCDQTHASGGGNVQWPDGSLCTEAPEVTDPMLGALGDGGGGTETMAPAAGSGAVGIATDCPETDQRGQPRGEPCTAGAVEAP